MRSAFLTVIIAGLIYFGAQVFAHFTEPIRIVGADRDTATIMVKLSAELTEGTDLACERALDMMAGFVYSMPDTVQKVAIVNRNWIPLPRIVTRDVIRKLQAQEYQKQLKRMEAHQ